MIHAAGLPEEFPQCDLRSTNEISPKNAEIMQFLSSFPEGEEFLKQRFPSGLPTNGAGYRTNNPKKEYTTWYNQRYGAASTAAVAAASTAAAEKVRKEEEKKRQDDLRRAKEDSERRLEEERKKTAAVEQRLTTETGELQGKLLAQATAGDLVARNSRLLSIQDEHQQGLVRFQDLAPVIDADKWVLRIPFIKNIDGVRRFINIPFDSEPELDRVMRMAANDAVRECAARNNDLVYLVGQANLGTLVFDLAGITKVQGYYAFALPIEYTDGRPDKNDAIVFSYDNQHDAEEAYRKAQFFMNIGAGKGGRSVQYKQVLTPRPAKPAEEPQAVTALMDAYYLLLDGASKNQEIKETANGFKTVFDEAYIAIELLCQVTQDANTSNAILLNVDKLSALAAAYASPGKTIESLKTNIRNSIKKAKWNTEIPELINDFFENFMLAWAQAQNLSSHDLFLKCIEDFCQCINSMKQTGIVSPLSFKVYEDALVADEKKVKELIAEEEQKIYDEAVLNFANTQQDVQDKITRLNVDWDIAQISEDDIRRHNNEVATGSTGFLAAYSSVKIKDNGQYKKIPSLLHFLINDPVFLLIALQNSTVLDFLTTKPFSSRLQPDKKNIYALFENELAFLTLREKQAFFVYLKNIIADFSALELRYYEITTNKNKTTVPQIEALLSIVKKSFLLPTNSNYRYTDDPKRIKAFVNLLLKFVNGDLAKESAEEALNQTMPFLTDKLTGKTTAVVDDIIEIAEIPERDVAKDQATLANSMGYVAEGLDVAGIIASKARHEILAEIEVLREAKKVVETDRFSALSFADPKRFPKMKSDKAALATKNAGRAAVVKAPVPVAVAPAVAAPLTPKEDFLQEVLEIKAALVIHPDIANEPFKTHLETIEEHEEFVKNMKGDGTPSSFAMKANGFKKIRKDLGMPAAPKASAPKAPSIAAVSASASASAAAGGGGVVKKVATPIKTSGETPDQLKTRLLGEITAIKANLDTRDVSVEPLLSQNEEILAIETAIAKIASPGPRDVMPLSMHGRKIQEIKKALGL